MPWASPPISRRRRRARSSARGRAGRAPRCSSAARARPGRRRSSRSGRSSCWQPRHRSPLTTASAPTDRGYSPLPLSHINGLVVGLSSTLLGRQSAWCSTVAVCATLLGNRRPLRRDLAQPCARDDHHPRQPRAAAAPAVIADIRFARSASAPLPSTSSSASRTRSGVGVLETYGMTEAASQITANPLDASSPPARLGRPARRHRPVLLDDDGDQPAPAAGRPRRDRGPRASPRLAATGDLGRLRRRRLPVPRRAEPTT